MKLRMPNNTSRGNPDNFHNMIFLSLIAHFIVIAVVFLLIPSSPKRLTFGPVYSVQLVGSEVALAKDSSLLSDFMQNGEGSASSIMKREVAGLNSAPVKKEETEKLNIEKAIESIKQKELPRQETGATTADKSETDASARAGTRASQAQATAQRNEYISLIWSRVKGNWTLPPALMPKENVETIIDVKISRSGALEYIGFEKSSGNRYFDDSALNAVKKSTPFPPLPPYISGNYIEIGIRFHSTELR